MSVPRPRSSRFVFDRFGGVYHLRIASAEDLRQVLELQETLWVATGAPTATLNADPAFLRRLDGDDDGRIWVRDVRAAIRWLLAQLNDLDGVRSGNTCLELTAIATETAEGARIHSTAQQMLVNLGKPGVGSIELADVRKIKQEEEGKSVSEAGVVLPDADSSWQIRRFLADILATVGGEPHPSGKEGVSAGKLELFLQQAQAAIDWWISARSGAEGSETIRPWGDDTAEAWKLYQELSAKIDQYFALCDAVGLDPRVASRVWPWGGALERLDFSSAEAVANNLALTPLAPPDGGGRLDLKGEINPFYARSLRRFAELVLPPSPDGVRRLGRDLWQKIKSQFAPHQQWLAARPETALTALKVEMLEHYLNPEYEKAVRALLEQSHGTAIVLDSVRLVEKLILYQACLLPLANSFVSFPDLYLAGRRALFEMGTLVIEGRHFNLCVLVRDRARHAAAVEQSNMFVLYVRITAGKGQELYELAAPVTWGGRSTLKVGGRGLFIDRDGGEFDAEIVQIVENPISLREMLTAPFRRLSATVTGRIEKMTGEAKAGLEAQSKDALDQMSSGSKTGAAQGLAQPAAPQAASAVQAAGGLIAGGGIALAAVGSSTAYIITTVASLGWKTIVGIVAMALVGILSPVVSVAILKLRQRYISTLLEGSGWAFNARLRMTRRQARSITTRPPFPRGSQGIYRRYGWLLLFAALAAAAVAVLTGFWPVDLMPAGTPAPAGEAPAEEPGETQPDEEAPAGELAEELPVGEAPTEEESAEEEPPGEKPAEEEPVEDMPAGEPAEEPAGDPSEGA